LEAVKRYSIKKIILAILWLGVSVGVIVLLVAAMRKNDAAPCKAVVIKITGIETNQKFVDEKDVLQIISNVCGRNPVGKASGSFNLRDIEVALQKNAWIKSAQLFFGNDGTLQVKINERKPIARIFTTNGTSYYIDSNLKMLPLSNKFSARLPLFTGFPTDGIVLTPTDSLLLKNIKAVSMVLQQDSFCNALIEQIDITTQHQFEMVPKVGNTLIAFGNADDAGTKFEKLKLFYKNILVKTGWQKYSSINVQYSNQVVAKLRGQEDKTADSVRTIQMMQIIATTAARMAEDSIRTIVQDDSGNTTDSTIIQQSIQREDNVETSNAVYNTLQPQNPPVVTNPAPNPLPSAKLPASKPVIAKPKLALPPVAKSAAPKPIVPKPTPTTILKPANPTTKPNPVKKPEVTKPTIAKPSNNTNKPKAVMPSKNDY
jgi:cell division protein FtsQ